MRPYSIVRTLAAAALIAVPSLAMAAPDQNTNGGTYNNGCNGQWVNGQCVNNNNNGQWNNNGRHRHRNQNDGDDRRNGRDNNNGNDDNNGNYNGRYGNNRYGNGYGNNGYGNNRYGNGGNNLTGTVSSFSPYNLYLNNGLHVVLHNGTVINPTGANLAPGMRVRVIGNRNGDGTFNANEVDVVGNGYGNQRYLR